jgi:hypothetical protein
MAPAIQSPEDLEMLLEDAFVLRDPGALAALFEPGAVVAGVAGPQPVSELGEAFWEIGYWSEPRRIVQGRRTAVVIGTCAVSVMHRSETGSWHYAICVFDDGGETL